MLWTLSEMPLVPKIINCTTNAHNNMDGANCHPTKERFDVLHNLSLLTALHDYRYFLAILLSVNFIITDAVLIYTFDALVFGFALYHNAYASIFEIQSIIVMMTASEKQKQNIPL